MMNRIPIRQRIQMPVSIVAVESNKLERLRRYMAKGPLSNERLSIDGDGPRNDNTYRRIGRFSLCRLTTRNLR